MSRTTRKQKPGVKLSHQRPRLGGMLVNARSVPRAGFRCYCCQTPPGIGRVVERRKIKRSERQKFRQSLDY